MQKRKKLYSVAYNIGILINIIINAINASVTPWMYEKIRTNCFEEIRNNTNMLCIIMLAIIILLILFAPEALWIIASSEYSQAVYVIPPVAASTLFTFMYNLFANIEFYYGERKYVSIGSMSAAILNIGLNYVCIPKYGYVAAAYTTLFCYIVYGLSHLWFTCLVLKKNNVLTDAFDKRKILFISIITIGTMFFANILYTSIVLRYIVIIGVLTYIFVFRNRIVNVFYTIKKK